MANRFSLSADIQPAVDERAAEREAGELARTFEQELGDLQVGAGGGFGGVGGGMGGGMGGAGATAAGAGAVARGGGALSGAAGGLAKVTLAGAVGFGILQGVQKLSQASPALKQTSSMFGEAMSLFFRPFGNFLSGILRPFAASALQMAVNFNKIYSEEGLGIAVTTIAGSVIDEWSSGFGDAVSDAFGGKADISDLFTIGATTVTFGTFFTLSTTVLAAKKFFEIGESLAPDVADVIELGASLTPDVGDVVSLGRKLAPDVGDVIDLGQKLAPNVDDVIELGKDLAPDVDDLLSIGQELTPDWIDVVAISDKLTPDWTDVVAISGKLTPDAGDVIEIQGDITKNIRDIFNLNSGNDNDFNPWDLDPRNDDTGGGTAGVSLLERIGGMFPQGISDISQVLEGVDAPTDEDTQNTVNETQDTAETTIDAFERMAEGALNIDIPGTARGGVATGPQMRQVGEAGAEAIMPLDRLSREISRAIRDGQRTAGGGDDGMARELSGKLDTLIREMRRTRETLADQEVTVETAGDASLDPY